MITSWNVRGFYGEYQKAVEAMKPSSHYTRIVKKNAVSETGFSWIRHNSIMASHPQSANITQKSKHDVKSPYRSRQVCHKKWRWLNVPAARPWQINWADDDDNPRPRWAGKWGYLRLKFPWLARGPTYYLLLLHLTLYFFGWRTTMTGSENAMPQL